MDTVRLRTMTWKSRFNQGRYTGMTVEEVFQLGIMKLSYIYYNYQAITFTDEILEAIKIREDERIEKPGINKKMFEKKMVRARYGVYGEKTNFVMAARRRKEAKARLRRLEDSQQFSKGQLQWMNVKGKSSL